MNGLFHMKSPFGNWRKSTSAPVITELYTFFSREVGDTGRTTIFVNFFSRNFFLPIKPTTSTTTTTYFACSSSTTSTTTSSTNNINYIDIMHLLTDVLLTASTASNVAAASTADDIDWPTDWLLRTTDINIIIYYCILLLHLHLLLSIASSSSTTVCIICLLSFYLSSLLLS